ncbi:MAG TPA: gephyrin-like molybdotransferase Glp [Burkholderiales bacterium]|nr:gephyrin-like molybdotransferase Glp [Burkholderiales bacterium]
MSELKKIISCMDDYDPDAMNVDRAREVIRALMKPIQANERVAVRTSLGRILGEDIISTINVPAHDNSAMDGWAVRGSDLQAEGPTRLLEVGVAYAGRAYGEPVNASEAVRIMTGAVMPEGTDTVVIQEVVQKDGEHILVPPGQKAGQNRRLAGEDLSTGKAVLRAGRLIRPADLGLIASLGIAEVPVRRRLRVAFFSTGDELASVGTVLKEGEVYDSNRYTIYGMLARLGVDIIDMGVIRDDPAALEEAFKQASASADAVITSGGVSVGEADFTRDLMAKLGDVLFWKIAMKPGRPMAFGQIGDAYFFGLPGNPVSVMITFYEFVRGALLALAGRTEELELPSLKAICTSALRKNPGRTEFQRGILSRNAAGEWQVSVTGAQGSGVLRSMSEANCIIVLEHERGSVKPGDAVSVQLMEGLL